MTAADSPTLRETGSAGGSSNEIEGVAADGTRGIPAASATGAGVALPPPPPQPVMSIPERASAAARLATRSQVRVSIFLTPFVPFHGRRCGARLHNARLH